jgi:hypothetical protein
VVALLAAAGVDPSEIARRAGLSSVAFTYVHYGHLFAETDRDAAAKLDSAVKRDPWLGRMYGVGVALPKQTNGRGKRRRAEDERSEHESPRKVPSVQVGSRTRVEQHRDIRWHRVVERVSPSAPRSTASSDQVLTIEDVADRRLSKDEHGCRGNQG